MTAPLEDLRAAVAALAGQRRQALTDLSAAAAHLEVAVQNAHDAAAIGDDATAATELAEADSLRTQRRDVLARIEDLNGQVRSAIDQFSDAGLDPADGDPEVPLVLLPVRLETRYTADGAGLRVRIYPDDVHIDRLDRGLTSVELTAGQAYWTALWTGTATDDAAWTALVHTVHPDRAGWVAWSCTPDNLGSRPDPPGPAPLPDFPAVVARPRRAPMARALPDRFVVVVTQAAGTRTALGNPVPSEVPVGLPRDDDQSVLAGNTGLGPGTEWLTDFAEAERIGLAVTVALPSPDAPVDSVLAFGVRTSLAQADAAAELDDLLLSHRFSDGLAVLAQGTPSNNTETDRSAWTRHADPRQPATTALAATPLAQSAAARMSAALGLAAGTLAGIDGADVDDQAVPRAANTALWSASWGSFLDRLLPGLPSGGLDDVDRDLLRSTFADHVRGRGPLAAMRIGRQPYGVLPVAAVGGPWRPSTANRLDGRLVAFLDRVRRVWRGGVAAVPVLSGTTDIDATLLEILGLAPLALGLRVRSIASETTCSVVPGLIGLDLSEDIGVQRLLDLVVWQSLGFAPGVIGTSGSLGRTTRPLGLPVVDDSDVDFIDRLLAGADRRVASVLQALLELALDADQRAVEAAAPTDVVEKVVELSAEAAPELHDRIAEAVAGVREGSPDRARVNALVDELAGIAGSAGPVRLAVEMPFAALRTDLAESIEAPGLSTEVTQGLVLRSLQAWLRAQAHLAATRAALGVLRGATTAERRYAVTETLDCCSHRLDAWLAAPVSRRLGELRAGTPAGVQLGAYGWVEDLRPGAALAGDGGYLLAPSITHAATAGVLRSAYLSHTAGTGAAGAFAVDLSSDRVRRGLAVLDGVRTGQPLGALLGYRLERMLRESPHDIQRFVLPLRVLAPLNVGRIADRAEAPPQQAREAIRANNTVDGIALLALRAGGTDIRGALNAAPKNNPYLPPDTPWTGPSDPQWAAIGAAMDEIGEDQDCVADLLLAEGVHQLVQGNLARSAAAMDAAAGGDAVPPDPDVVHVPPRGTALTHRLMLLANHTASGIGGWSTTTPRASAEPRLARWCETALGAATDVVVQQAADGTRITLDAAGLAAIDAVHDGGTGALERRLRAALPQLTDAPLAMTRDASWPAGSRSFGDLTMHAASLARLLIGAEPLLPPSLAAAGVAARRVVTPADQADLVTRVTTAADTLAARADTLAAALNAAAPDHAAIGAAVDAIAAFGVSAAVGGDPGAAAVLAEARRRHAQATATLAAGADIAAARQAGSQLFGTGFAVVPVVSPAGRDLFAAGYDRLDPGQGPLHRFVRDMGSVRTGVGRYAQAMLVGDALGLPRMVRVAQLAASGARGTDRWLGLPFDPAHPSPEVPVTDVLVDAADPITGMDPVAGLVLDEWTEFAPMTIERPDGAGGTVREVGLTAGLAINAERSRTRAPQAILLALSGADTRWSTASLTALLGEVLDIAKLRAVTLEHAPWAGRVVPALQEQSWSLQGETTPSLKHLVFELADTQHMIPFVKE